MFDYPIFPTESFLLGVCIGEYDANHASWNNCTLRFIEHLQKRLVPFYPNFAHEAKTVRRHLSDEEKDELNDVNWEKVDADTSIGWRKGDRSRYYYKLDCDDVFAIRESRWIGPERRSLVDLLVDFVSPHSHLHGEYRNVSQHELETHPCTIRDAKYFLNGIHVLLDLCDARLAAN